MCCVKKIIILEHLRKIKNVFPYAHEFPYTFTYFLATSTTYVVSYDRIIEDIHVYAHNRFNFFQISFSPLRLTASVCRREDKKRVSPDFCQANLLRGRLSILRNDPWTHDKLSNLETLSTFNTQWVKSENVPHSACKHFACSSKISKMRGTDWSMIHD